MLIRLVKAKSILTKTGGFLRSYTHTINPYQGCQLGLSLCGYYCYAKAIAISIKKDYREWGRYIDAKINAAELYKQEYKRCKHLRIFMSSVTEPYPPIEQRLMITRQLLNVMLDHPPDKLVIQTHTPNPLRDMDIIKRLSNITNVAVSITLETDMENCDLAKYYNIRLRHIYSIKDRLDALRIFKGNGIKSIATISPLLPLKDPYRFAKDIDKAADYAILDHYLIGDGADGFRTSSRLYFKEPLPIILSKNGFDEWNGLEKFYEIVDIFKDVLGEDRIEVSSNGFNNI